MLIQFIVKFHSIFNTHETFRTRKPKNHCFLFEKTLPRSLLINFRQLRLIERHSKFTFDFLPKLSTFDSLLSKICCAKCPSRPGVFRAPWSVICQNRDRVRKLFAPPKFMNFLFGKDFRTNGDTSWIFLRRKNKEKCLLWKEMF